MSKYTRPQFLLNCDCESVDLQAHVLTVTNDNLGRENYSPILLSELDCTINTEEDIAKMVSRLDDKLPILLVNDRPATDNPIVRDFGDETIKAYIQCFDKYGIDCSLVTAMQ
ncbi:MAG: hypothetical protein Q4F84_04345 [Fibrobacter sp.]|nr:hypothetical protein [Fibrobacter sp.]